MLALLIFGIIIGVAGVCLVVSTIGASLIVNAFILIALGLAQQSSGQQGEAPQELDAGITGDILNIFIWLLVFELVIYAVSLVFRSKWIKLFYIPTLLFTVGLVVNALIKGGAGILLVLGIVCLLPLSDFMLTRYRKLRREKRRLMRAAQMAGAGGLGEGCENNSFDHSQDDDKEDE